HCNESEYIGREITVAGNAHKVIIPFRIENVEPKRGLSVRLANLHWIDAFVARERAIEEIVRAVIPQPTMIHEVSVQKRRFQFSSLSHSLSFKLVGLWIAVLITIVLLLLHFSGLF